jgi:hypothetical protein
VAELVRCDVIGSPVGSDKSGVSYRVCETFADAVGPDARAAEW